MRIGVDVGTVRVGVAASDPDGVLATPLATLARDPRGDADLTRLAALVADRAAVEVVVGLPTSLSGRPGPGRPGRPRLRHSARGAHPSGSGPFVG